MKYIIYMWWGSDNIIRVRSESTLWLLDDTYKIYAIITREIVGMYHNYEYCIISDDINQYVSFWNKLLGFNILLKSRFVLACLENIGLKQTYPRFRDSTWLAFKI